MDKLKIGIIGAGYIGREHARSINRIASLLDNQILIECISDIDINQAKDAAQHYNILKFTDNSDEIINNEDIDTVFICVPTKFAKEFVLKAVNAKKRIFLEKPFAVNIQDAEEIRNILQESNLPNQIGFVLRYTPTYHALKILIEKAKSESDLRTVLLRDDQMFPISGREHNSEWRGDKNIAGAGVLIEHGIHDIDLFEWLFGKIKSVLARKKNYHGHTGIEDYIEVQMEFELGLYATMVHMWHNIPAHQSIRSFEIFFNKSLITLDKYNMEKISVRGQKSIEVFERPDLFEMVKQDKMFSPFVHKDNILYESDYYAIQDYWFLKNLLDKNIVKPSIKDGFRAYQIVDACYRSAESGERVMV